MKTPPLPHFLTVLGMCCALAAPLTAAEPNESNLTLLDTESPDIEKLAADAGDATTYAGLKERNKIGVFFSEKTVNWGSINGSLTLNFLKPWEEKSKWSREDFLHSDKGPVFFMNSGCYQPLPVNNPGWNVYTESLSWYSLSAEASNSMRSILNDPAGKVGVYKRFEFPATLPSGTATYFELDRAKLDASARKLVIVVHGWQPEPNTDPYADGNWPSLLKNLSEEIKAKSSYAPEWDVYAYRWGRDAYTGPVLYGGKHADGRIGKGVENGTQAAEIGYQHGLVLGKLLWDRGIPLEKVHFIAHSAGTWVARSASLYLKAKYGSSLQQQITLLDPYNPHRGWVEDGEKTDVDDSILSTELIENGWASKILQPMPTQNIAENIYSKDTFVAGTNEVYGQGFVNIEVGKSLVGVAPADNRYATLWDDHGGPINFYAYTVNPSDETTRTDSDRVKRNGYADVAGWEHSLFMREYYQWIVDHPIPQLEFNYLIRTSYDVPPLPQVFIPQNSGDGPVFAPASIPEWSRVLVDVDSNAWVRLMLVPTSGGPAVLAGPARLAADGTFAITLDDGRVLGGGFNTTTTPPALTLTLDGNPLGQPSSAAQGSVAQKGFDVNVNASGNVVISAVLADGTAAMTVSKDAANNGWEGSGVGTVDANGNIVVTGANGLQVTGQVLEDGSLATQVVPPQVPEIHVVDAAGTGLVTGTASIDCGRVAVDRASRSFLFTIRNTGTVDLMGLGVSVEGTNGVDFAVSALGVTSLAPDAEATLQVTFTPGAAGSRSGTLRIFNNDANENPFEIALTGEGFEAAPVEVAEAAVGTLAAGGENYYRVAITEPGVLIVWSEGASDTHGLILAANGAPLGEDGDSGPQANFRTSADVVPGDFFIRVAGGDTAASGPFMLRTRFIPATEPMQVSHFEKDGPDVMLGFTNTKGALHIVEHSTDMQNWLPLETLVGQGAEMLVPMTGMAYANTGFFRVGLVATGYDPDVAKGIDQPEAVVSIEGDAAWFTQTSVSHDGTDAARSGMIYENQSSGFSTQITGPVNVSFWWKVSSAAGDKLRFLIDGVEQPGAISGETGWLQQIRSLGSGNHTLSWSYAKDDSGTAGQDCGWVDEVVYTIPADIAVEQPAGTDLADGATVTFGPVPTYSSHKRTFTIRNMGELNLTGLNVSKSGTNASEYSITQPTATTLAPGENTTFAVTFTPYSTGARNATLQIASNDPDENPFDLVLSGTGGQTGTYGYSITDGQVAITSYSGPGGEVVIPAEILGMPVTSMGSNTFGYGNSLTHLTIPAGVTNISSSAFNGCETLVAITVNPENPSYSSLDGILYDKAMTTLIRCPEGKAGEIVIPAGVTKIGSSAFRSCLAITGVMIPASVETIENFVFQSCDALTAINVDLANANYSSLNGILYDKTLTALIRCPGGMTGSVAIPTGVTDIADYAFDGCAAVTEVSMPGSLLRIGNYAFRYCNGLTDVTIPNGVASIGIGAFRFCQGLTSVSIPGSVMSIGDVAFEQCVALAEVLLADGVTSIGVYAFRYCYSLTGVILPDTITSIGTGAFRYCTNLESVTLPVGLVTIASQTFNGCSSLSGIVIPASVISVGTSAFYECGALESVSFSSALTNIGSYAFGACTSLTSLSIPASVTSIGDGPFAGCLSLPEITVDPGNLNYVSVGGVLFNKAMTHLIQCPAGRSGNYTVPSGVTSIGRNAFGWCESLTSVTIPAAVTSIGDNAFLKCDNLTSVVFLGDAPSVGWGIFDQSPDGFLSLHLPGSTGFSTPIWQGYPAVTLATSQEITVIGPDGDLADGVGNVSFGNAYPGNQRQRTFIILNTGMIELNGLAVTLDGVDAGDFSAGSLGATALATGESTTVTVTFAPTVIGVRNAILRVASNDDDENPFDVELAGAGLDPALDVAAAIDVSPRPVTNGGQADWFWQAGVSHDGIDAVQSGDIGDGQTSSFSITATGPGTVSFRWKVSSEGGYDFLRFLIDGIHQGTAISGNVDWQQVSYPLAEGVHILEWSYEKDNIMSADADCGWVDEVSLPPGNALESWRLASFGTTANTGTAADFADMDRDGVCNLMEYAFELHPLQASAHLMPGWQRVGDALTCVFDTPAGVTGVVYGAEWSPTMEPGSWLPVTDSGVTPQHVFSVPIDSNKKKFVRLKVAVP